MNNHCEFKPIKGKVTVVLDSQAGSCGKGKFVGYIALRDKPSIAINNFMSNAGHTFVREDGREIMTQHLPTSLVNKDTVLCIGPGSAITPRILLDEIIRYKDLIGDRKIHIHPRAMVILHKHTEKEKKLVRSGSTFKGCGVAQADKIMRVPNTILFGEWYENQDRCMLTDKENDAMDSITIVDTGRIVNVAIDNGLDVLIEGSQGCDLDINYGLGYPHCTSRQCHVGQLVADCGISPLLVTNVIMIMRPYPIRISNQTNIGLEISSGDYCGSKEITWDEVKRRCGAPDNIEFGEQTTVTKKTRRVFEMNWDRLKYTSMINRPTEIVLNFAQYLDWNIQGKKSMMTKSEEINNFIDKVFEITGAHVTLIGTGAKNDEIIDMKNGNKDDASEITKIPAILIGTDVTNNKLEDK